MTSEDDTTPVSNETPDLDEEAVDLEQLRHRLFGESNPDEPPPPTSDMAAYAKQLFTPNPRHSRSTR